MPNSTLLISLVLQNKDKILTIRDISAPTTSPWGVPANFTKYFDSGDGGHGTTSISIEITIETKEKTYTAIFTREDFAMATSGNTLEIDTQEEVFYNIGMRDGVLEAIAYTSTDLSGLETLPDGIYSIKYSLLDSAATDYDVDSEYVLTNKADEVIRSKTDEITDKIYVCPNYDLEEILSYLVYRSLHLSLTSSRLVSNREAILNTLDHINNEDIQYYVD